MSKYVIDSATLVSIGDAVREKDGTTAAILVKDIPARILAIETGGGSGGGGFEIPESAFTIKGPSALGEPCEYMFAHGKWDWFIELYGDRIKTEKLDDTAHHMFYDSNLKKIPFDLNFTSNQGTDMSSMFADCFNLEEIPKISGVKPIQTSYIFSGCRRLKEIPESVYEDWDWSNIDTQTTTSLGKMDGMFSDCHSLRKLPMKFLSHGNPVASYNYSIYYNGFVDCNALDEIVDLPIPHRNAKWTAAYASVFYRTFHYCSRLKRLTFETNEDGSPIVLSQVKSQSLDLSAWVGYAASSEESQLKTYAGFTTDKKVTNDATYQALKNDEDWYTCDVNYSRYNHDSAVETINSLPDVSAGGSNTIKFTGASGAKTDGGAINTLTEEEIAVAAAKGWTVSLA